MQVTILFSKPLSQALSLSFLRISPTVHFRLHNGIDIVFKVLFFTDHCCNLRVEGADLRMQSCKTIGSLGHFNDRGKRGTASPIEGEIPWRDPLGGGPLRSPRHRGIYFRGCPPLRGVGGEGEKGWEGRGFLARSVGYPTGWGEEPKGFPQAILPDIRGIPFRGCPTRDPCFPEGWDHAFIGRGTHIGIPQGPAALALYRLCSKPESQYTLNSTRDLVYHSAEEVSPTNR